MMAAHLWHEKENQQNPNSERNTNKPEAHLPRQILDNITIQQRAATDEDKLIHIICHFKCADAHIVIPDMIEKLQATDRLPLSWTLKLMNM